MAGRCTVKDLVLSFGKVLSVTEVSHELRLVCGLDLTLTMVVNSVPMITMYPSTACLQEVRYFCLDLFNSIKK